MLRDENWKNNPDIKLNMVSYLGVPILFPDGNPFRTIPVKIGWHKKNRKES